MGFLNGASIPFAIYYLRRRQIPVRKVASFNESECF